MQRSQPSSQKCANKRSLSIMMIQYLSSRKQVRIASWRPKTYLLEGELWSMHLKLTQTTMHHTTVNQSSHLLVRVTWKVDSLIAQSANRTSVCFCIRPPRRWIYLETLMVVLVLTLCSNLQTSQATELNMQRAWNNYHQIIPHWWLWLLGPTQGESNLNQILFNKELPLAVPWVNRLKTMRIPTKIIPMVVMGTQLWPVPIPTWKANPTGMRTTINCSITIHF